MKRGKGWKGKEMRERKLDRIGQYIRNKECQMQERCLACYQDGKTFLTPCQPSNFIRFTINRIFLE